MTYSPACELQRKPLRTIGIMANSGKYAALEIARDAESYLNGHGVKVLIQHHVAESWGDSARGLSDDEVTDGDAVIVLGGDGTILATSRECGPKGTPMLPVHLGRFGFLTEVAPTAIRVALDKLMSRDYTVEQRLMLSATARRDGQSQTQASVLALNDIVVANGPLSRVLHLRMSVDGRYVTTYAADGIIVASPTGSTAYSLSAGGPLVHPDVSAILVTPICPHTLTSRALLLPAKSEVTIEVERDPQDIVRVTIDGQLGFPLQSGDAISVRHADHPAHIISVGGADFYDKLQNKLRWGERLVY